MENTTTTVIGNFLVMSALERGKNNFQKREDVGHLERKKEMDKIQSLKECIELWTWLAENPINSNGEFNQKEDWPGWEKIDRYIFQCPCCEYAISITDNVNTMCSRCPIYWPQGKYPKNDRPCNGSFYGEWCDACDVEELVINARMIVSLAEDALKKLER